MKILQNFWLTLVYKLLSSLILNNLSNITDKEDIGLYKGDGLIILRNLMST